MRCGLRPVTANRHAAPTPRVRLADVQEPQCAACALAFSYQGEILLADEIANRICKWLQKRFGILPSPIGAPSKCASPIVIGRSAAATGRNLHLPICFILLEQCVDWR